MSKVNPDRSLPQKVLHAPLTYWLTKKKISNLILQEGKHPSPIINSIAMPTLSEHR
jgi:hypothetical protein